MIKQRTISIPEDVDIELNKQFHLYNKKNNTSMSLSQFCSMLLKAQLNNLKRSDN